MKMLVKEFDSLIKRDFDNGAIKDAIRNSLKERETLLASQQPNAADGNKLAVLEGEEYHLEYVEAQIIRLYRC